MIYLLPHEFLKGSPPRKISRVVADGPAAILAAQPRNSVLQVRVKGTYGAGDTYNLDDVIRICKAVSEKKMKLAWLYPDNAHHDPVTMNVPRTTIVRWLMDDVEAMQAKGERGVSGVPHWRAHTEIRRCTTLPTAGGYRGSGGPMLGMGEKALHVYLSDASRMGRPVTEEELPILLRQSARDLKVTTPFTGKLYAEDTDVSSLTKAFLARAEARGIPLVVRKGEGLSRQRAESATVENMTLFQKELSPVLSGEAWQAWPG